MFLLYLSVFVATCYYLFVRPLKYWKNLNVKQSDNCLPLFGDTLPRLLGKISVAESFERLYKIGEGERYSGMYQFVRPILMLRDPELIKQVMVKDFDHFVDHVPFGNTETDPMWGNNLFALRGQKWRDMRNTLSPTFTSSKMKFLFGLIDETAQEFTNYFLKQKKDVFELEFKETFTRFTNDVIATSAFGIKVNSIEDPENDFYLMGKEVSGPATFFDVLKVFLFLVLPKVALYFKLTMFSDRVTTFFRGLIKDTIDQREKRKIVRPDLIHLLMEARKDGQNNEKLTNDEITAQGLVFFFAGFESVSSAMCFTTYELGVNQDIQDKLREEIQQTFEENDGKVTYELIQSLKYMDMVLLESLRKWPPFASMNRICTKPITIQPTKPTESPIPIKLDDLIVFPIHAIQRDPKYFPDPDKFIPERFSEENKQKIVPYTNIPFGGGPRLCIGQRFALMEIKIILFYLLKEFKIVPNDKTDIPLMIHPRSFGTTAQNGFHLNLEKLKD